MSGDVHMGPRVTSGQTLPGATERRRERQAQTAWASRSLPARLKVVREARRLVAERGEALAAVASPRLSAAQRFVCEVLPLADACRFLLDAAPSVLATRRLGSKWRPRWLRGVDLEILREPYGRVLIIAAENYPLLLPGVQTLQALAAGNSVWLKPGRAGRNTCVVLRQLLLDAGLDPALLSVLDDSVSTGREALEWADKVVLTGSANTGRDVLSRASGRLLPATLELSGHDAVFVLEGADVHRVADAVRFGLELNQGATCVAPRRVFVHRNILPTLEQQLLGLLENSPAVRLETAVTTQVRDLIQTALADGARTVVGRTGVDENGAARSVEGSHVASRDPEETVQESGEDFSPTVLSDVRPDMAIFFEAFFAPVTSLVPVRDMEEALEADKNCPYALGASVFGPERTARDFARRVRPGVVTVNDTIVPTADPRLPFPARQDSGFGVTRGVEGLLEMTRPKAISTRSSGWRHLEAETPGDERLFKSLLLTLHSGRFTERMRALLELARSVAARQRALRPPTNPCDRRDATK